MQQWRPSLKADTNGGAGDCCPMYFVNSWALGWSWDLWSWMKLSVWPVLYHYCLLSFAWSVLRARSRFRVSHHTTYCARQSSTSYWPVVHASSQFGVRVCCSHTLCESRPGTRAQQQVPRHFDCTETLAYWSLFVPLFAFVSFTLYGAD